MGLYADLFCECENDRGYSLDETSQKITQHVWAAASATADDTGRAAGGVDFLQLFLIKSWLFTDSRSIETSLVLYPALFTAMKVKIPR